MIAAGKDRQNISGNIASLEDKKQNPTFVVDAVRVGLTVNTKPKVAKMNEIYHVGRAVVITREVEPQGHSLGRDPRHDLPVGQIGEVTLTFTLTTMSITATLILVILKTTNATKAGVFVAEVAPAQGTLGERAILSYAIRSVVQEKLCTSNLVTIRWTFTVMMRISECVMLTAMRGTLHLSKMFWTS